MRKMKKSVAIMSMMLFLFTAFLINKKANAKSQTDDGIVCGTDVCVVDEAKNRFLARGCKTKPDFDCVVGGPGLPSIG
ncbi:hypothetical protein [uncultured Roseivirga sp.]|uniref:hypothetical protein n=1 Tax=uncultured Roseivirga sp. TaxID=543088 RepID=UPI0030D73EF3